MNVLLRESPVDGLLVVGHGTREARGTAAFRAVVERVAKLAPTLAVEPAFLELAEPSIAAGIRALLEGGAKQIAVAPLLLFAAGHAKRDIPAAVREVLVDRQDVHVCQADVLGLHEQILELSARRFDEALIDREPVAPSETLLVMVGRGSRDAEAIAEMHRFATARGEQSPVAAVETCFLAMAEPTLAATLDRAATLGYRRVVVQPHLLFEGELIDRVRSATAERRRCWPDVEWIVTPPLEDVETLARVVLDRCGGFRDSIQRMRVTTGPAS